METEMKMEIQMGGMGEEIEIVMGGWRQKDEWRQVVNEDGEAWVAGDGRCIYRDGDEWILLKRWRGLDG